MAVGLPDSEMKRQVYHALIEFLTRLYWGDYVLVVKRISLLLYILRDRKLSTADCDSVQTLVLHVVL